ncbi:MAG TPA: MFS transporter [Acidimicrobiales bacterium]|nr:MFS transporter [Acidimicrobiales bacterium]
MDDELTLGAAGGEEVVVVPWPRLLRTRSLRRRLSARVSSSDRYRWWVLWTVLGGLVAVQLTFTMLAVALPRIGRDLHASTNTLTWVITGPLLMFGIAAPVVGKLGDIHGHRRVYVIGLGTACACAALSAAAWSAGSLIAARTLSGLEGAATGAAGVALIFSVFEPGDRVKAMGFWSLVGAGSPVLGVAIGGPIVHAFGWRWIFVGQAPLIAAAFVVALLVLPETSRGARQRLDLAGAATLTVAVTSVLFALNRGPEWGWTRPAVLAGFVVCPLAAVAFVAVERRAVAPLLPLDYLRRRNFVAPIATQVFSNFAYLGGFFLAPLLLDKFFHYSESRIGLLVLARPIAFSIVAPVAGYLAVRTGERAAAVVGTLAVAASMLVFAGVGLHSSDVHIVTALVLSGIGLGISSPSVASSVGNAVDEADLGIASAAQQLLTQVGVVAGIQLMETVQAARQSTDGLVGSFHDAFLLGGGVCLLGVVCASLVRSAEREPAVAGAAAPVAGP